MRITEVREQPIKLQSDIANAVVNFSSHTVSLIVVQTDVVRDGKPVYGCAFNSIGRFAQSGLLRERFIPRLLAAEPDSLLGDNGDQFNIDKITSLVMANEKPGGHGDRATAVGGLELALWDLNAKLQDEPAYKTIAREIGEESALPPDVSVYAAGGYYQPGKAVSALEEEIQSYLDMGFTQVKIKIGGASLKEDCDRIEAAIKLLGDGGKLSVDANGRFDLNTALDYASAMQDYNLRWYEEAGDPLDFALNAELADNYQQPIATGENLFSAADTNNLLNFGGMRSGKDIFQMDPGLSYGLGEYLKILKLLESRGFTRAQLFPHGGHMINLHIVAALGLGGCEAYPGVFQPVGGYNDDCLQQPGFATPSAAPGFGLEQKDGLNSLVKELLA